MARSGVALTVFAATIAIALSQAPTPSASLPEDLDEFAEERELSPSPSPSPAVQYSSPIPTTSGGPTVAAFDDKISIDVEDVDALTNSVSAATLIQEQIAKMYHVPVSSVHIDSIGPSRANGGGRRLSSGTVKIHFTINGAQSSATPHAADGNLAAALATVGIKATNACMNKHGHCSGQGQVVAPPKSGAPHHLLTGKMFLNVQNIQVFMNARSGSVLAAAVAAAYQIAANFVTIQYITPTKAVSGQQLTSGNVNVGYEIRDYAMAVPECAGTAYAGVVKTAINAGLAHVGLLTSVNTVSVPCATKEVVTGSTVAPVTTTPAAKPVAPAAATTTPNLLAQAVAALGATTTPAIGVALKYNAKDGPQPQKSAGMAMMWLAAGGMVVSMGMVITYARRYRIRVQPNFQQREFAPSVCSIDVSQADERARMLATSPDV